MRKLIITIILCLTLPATLAQNFDVSEFRPVVGNPAYPANSGPLVTIDGGHNNFHTVDGRYLTFVNLLRQDGYRVNGGTFKLNQQALEPIDILVIANALPPDRDSEAAANGSELSESEVALAFSDDEVNVLESWVRSGGSLLLIADHEPWPAAIANISQAFGIEFYNGYALDGPPGNRQGNLLFFNKAEGTLADNEVTDNVKSIATFLGSTLRVTIPHIPLLTLSDQAVAQTRIGAELPDADPVPGWLQGALIEHGAGRIAVFSEAAMFSAQVRGEQRRPMGMNSPGAEDNPRFMLQTLHWLSRKNPVNAL